MYYRNICLSLGSGSPMGNTSPRWSRNFYKFNVEEIACTQFVNEIFPKLCKNNFLEVKLGLQETKHVALCPFCVKYMKLGFLEYIDIRNVNFQFRYLHKIDEVGDQRQPAHLIAALSHINNPVSRSSCKTSRAVPLQALVHSARILGRTDQSSRNIVDAYARSSWIEFGQNTGYFDERGFVIFFSPSTGMSTQHLDQATTTSFQNIENS